MSLNLIRMECKTHVLHHLIRDYHINFLHKTQYILPYIMEIKFKKDWV